MTKSKANRLAFILALVAAGLAYAAVVIGYMKDGRIDVTPIGGGTLMLILAFAAWGRMKKGE
ncbi:MAG TPA: hypothetical protein VEY91_12860 [Candidatus Limnocylindria bacterium]|nr:hypothetical protein [Candidatus Limnocylindria bacterium]